MSRLLLMARLLPVPLLPVPPLLLALLLCCVPVLAQSPVMGPHGLMFSPSAPRGTVLPPLPGYEKIDWDEVNRVAREPMDVRENGPDKDYFKNLQAEHPEIWPHHPTPLPGQSVSLCPSCQHADGSRLAYQVPLLVNGHLLRRTPLYIPPPPKRPFTWYLAWALLIAFLGGTGAYLGTKFYQERHARAHAAGVARRRADAIARANAAACRSASDPASLHPPRPAGGG